MYFEFSTCCISVFMLMCLNLLRGENINLHEHFKSHTITALFWPHLHSVYTGVGLQHMLQLLLSYTSINETGTRNLVKIWLLKTSIWNNFIERKNKARQSDIWKLYFSFCVKGQGHSAICSFIACFWICRLIIFVNASFISEAHLQTKHAVN